MLCLHGGGRRSTKRKFAHKQGSVRERFEPELERAFEEAFHFAWEIERWIDDRTSTAAFYVETATQPDTRGRRRYGRAMLCEARYPIMPKLWRAGRHNRAAGRMPGREQAEARWGLRWGLARRAPQVCNEDCGRQGSQAPHRLEKTGGDQSDP